MNVVGQRYNYWNVIDDADPVLYPKGNPTIPHRAVVVKCVCGTVRSVLLQNLRNHRSKSCGCMKAYMQREARK